GAWSGGAWGGTGRGGARPWGGTPEGGGGGFLPGLPAATAGPFPVAGRLITADPQPRGTGAPKLCPASVEHTAIICATTSPDGPRWAASGQPAHTRPRGPAARRGPALGIEGRWSGKIVRSGSKVFPPSVERVKARSFGWRSSAPPAQTT